jgi:protein ImuA
VISSLSARPNRKACLARLKRQIERIERNNACGQRPEHDLPFAIDIASAERATGQLKAVDPFLAGGGMASPALHELLPDNYLDQPATRHFALALIANLIRRQMNERGQNRRQLVLWCQRTLDITEFGHLYGPGLKALGLPPEHVLMVTGKKDVDCLWAMEQALASRSLLAVVGQVDRADLIASRRLSLAASAHHTFCFLLPIHHGQDPSAARMRWRVKSAPSRPDHLDPKGLGPPSWHLNLERSPNGQTGHWTVEWDHATHHFHLAPSLGAAAEKLVSRNKQSSDVIAFNRAG